MTDDKKPVPGWKTPGIVKIITILERQAAAIKELSSRTNEVAQISKGLLKKREVDDATKQNLVAEKQNLDRKSVV